MRRLSALPSGWFNTNTRRIWIEKIPFFILAIIAAIVALLAQNSAGALQSLGTHDLSSRLLQALYGLAFYLWKTLLPVGLSPLYEMPRQLDLWNWRFLAGVVTTLGVGLVLVIFRRRWPAVLIAWAIYGICLAPTLGIAQSGMQLVADRYSYLACLSWAVIAAVALVRIGPMRQAGRLGQWVSLSGHGVAAITVVCLGLVTWYQTQIWRDSDTLWRHVLRLDPNSSVAHLNIGQGLARQGRAIEAIESFQRALQIFPEYAAAHVNLGRALTIVGKPQEAAQHFRKALHTDPNFAEGYNDLANTLLRQGALDEAIKQYQRALEIDPRYEIASTNLGGAFAQRNDIPAAIKQFQYSLQINPVSADAHYNLAKLYSHIGDPTSAFRHYQETLKINPADADALNDMGLLFARQGNLQEATARFRQALVIKPNSVAAYDNLGRAEAAQGNLTKAEEHFRRVLQMDPEYLPAHENLAQLYMMEGKKSQALSHYEQAKRILRARTQAKTQP